MNAKQLATINFQVAVWLSILGGIATLKFPDLIMPDSEDFFGPLRNNVLIVVGYLVISQIGLWIFRYRRGSRIEALVMAYTFIAAGAGLEFYSVVNSLPVSVAAIAALIYFGVSHGFYYFATQHAGGGDAGRKPRPDGGPAGF